MLEHVLIGVAGVLGLFVGVVALRPSAYRVVRTTEIAAPTELVFGVLNDLRQFAGVLVLFGTPWDRLDPQMQKTFAGSTAGVGQSLAWHGTKVGAGKMTIEGSVPGRKVRIRLAFVKPMESTATCELSIESTPTGSSVTWTMEGKHNFIGRAFGLFMNMDRMLGADLEKGLAELRLVTEGKPGGNSAVGAA